MSTERLQSCCNCTEKTCRGYFKKFWLQNLQLHTTTRLRWWQPLLKTAVSAVYYDLVGGWCPCEWGGFLANCGFLVSHSCLSDHRTSQTQLTTVTEILYARRFVPNSDTDTVDGTVIPQSTGQKRTAFARRRDYRHFSVALCNRLLRDNFSP